MIRSTFSLVVSTPESRRISSRTRIDRFCASSTMSSTLRPAAYCSMRKLLSVAISSAFFILKGEKPNCTRTACRKATADTCVWLICAITTSDWISFRKDSISVVVPEPISPVITTKPSVNLMVDSMYALARACCLDRYRDCGSGLRRNGSSFSLNGSRYMRARFREPGGRRDCLLACDHRQIRQSLFPAPKRPILRDAHPGRQLCEQPPCPPVARGDGGLDQ